jgi:hypothetical protein
MQPKTSRSQLCRGRLRASAEYSGRERSAEKSEGSSAVASLPHMKFEMNSKTFTGKDVADVRQQVWTWRKEHPRFFVIKQHALEGIVSDRDLVKRGQKLELKNVVSRRIDYQD